MSGALFRNVAADTARLIRRNAAAEIKQLQSRPYFRSPQLLGRAKETGISLPSSPSGLCSSAKVGFVGWYLGMVKSRPVITKSVTSSIIYVAADLSSQVLLLFNFALNLVFSSVPYTCFVSDSCLTNVNFLKW